MGRSQLVDDGLWELVQPLLPDRTLQQTGRPRVSDRTAFTAIVFVLVTITVGLFLGLRREQAARFSFLMSVPITAAAAVLSLSDAVGKGMDGHEGVLFLVGSVSAAVVGYLAIRFLL